MKVDKETLSGLEEFPSYLEGEEVEKFFTRFDIKFSAGHWCAGDFSDRFAPGGYHTVSSSDIISQMERVAQAGIKGIELHNTLFLDEKQKVDKLKIKEIKEALEDYSLIPTNMNLDFFSKPFWKWGSITHPDSRVRKKALDMALQAVEIAHQIGCSSLSLWPGTDGWDYNFEVDYSQRIQHLLEGCMAINEKAREAGLRFGVEAKLHEPREGNMIIPTTHLAGLIVKEVNSRSNTQNMGVVIDYGHEQMYAVEPAFTVYALKNLNVPIINFHINTAKTHSNDEDRIAGTGDIWKMVEFCYAAIDTGYSGWFGEDQFTYRTDPVKSMKLSKEIFANIMKKALHLYSRREEIKASQSTGDALQVLDKVKKIIIGE